jgi:hypothetical protein
LIFLGDSHFLLGLLAIQDCIRNLLGNYCHINSGSHFLAGRNSDRLSGFGANLFGRNHGFSRCLGSGSGFLSRYGGSGSSFSGNAVSFLLTGQFLLSQTLGLGSRGSGLRGETITLLLFGYAGCLSSSGFCRDASSFFSSNASSFRFRCNSSSFRGSGLSRGLLCLSSSSGGSLRSGLFSGQTSRFSGSGLSRHSLCFSLSGCGSSGFLSQAGTLSFSSDFSL